MKKKLAILNLNLNKGGAETAINNLLPYLSNRFDIHIVLFNGVIRYPINKNIPITILQNRAYSNIFNLLFLPVLLVRYVFFLRRNKIDISLSFLERPNFIACLTKFLGWKGKVLVAESTAISQFYKKETISGRFGRFLLRFCYPYADAIIPCSKFIAHDLISNIKIKIEPKKITPIYNGIPIEMIRDSSNGEVEIDMSRDFWFVHMGTFVEVKNHKLLVRAFSKIDNVKCKLLLIGKGEGKKEIDSLIDSLGLKDRVVNLGYVENPYRYISKSNCLVLSSNFEGLPTIIIEALSLGLPIISTDCFSGPREILAPTTDYTKQLSYESNFEVFDIGILTPTNNLLTLSKSMEYLYENYSDIILAKDKISKRSEFFSIKRMAKEYFQLIELISA